MNKTISKMAILKLINIHPRSVSELTGIYTHRNNLYVALGYMTREGYIVKINNKYHLTPKGRKFIR